MHEQGGLKDYYMDPFGEDFDAESLRSRYSFIRTNLEKVLKREISNQEIDPILEAFARTRRRTRSYSIPEEDLIGFRSFMISPEESVYTFDQNSSRSIFCTLAGVRDDGVVLEKQAELSFSDGDTIQSIAKAAQLDLLAVPPTAPGPNTIYCDRSQPLSLNPKGGYWAKRADDLASVAYNAMLDSGLRALLNEDESAYNTSLRYYYMFKNMHGSREWKHLRFGAYALLRSVDEDVRSRMFSHFDFSIGFANWLNGTDENMEISEQRKLYRHQALNRFPLMKMELTNRYVTSLIDDGQAPDIAMTKNERDAKALRGSLRRLVGITRQKAGQYAYREPLASARLFERLDPNVKLSSKADWVTAFSTLNYHDDYYRKLNFHRDVAYDVPSLSMREHESLSGLAHRVSNSNFPEGEQLITHVADTARFFKEKVVAPLVAQDLEGQGATREECEALITQYVFNQEFQQAVFLNLTSAQALRLACEYHERVLSLTEATTDPVIYQETLGNGVMVPGLLGNLELRNGLIARELNSLTSLEKQGKSQYHCVGGYFPSVVGGKSIVFSIENPDGKILSTVEIRVGNLDAKSAKDRYSLAQNYSVRNTTPSKEAIIAGAALLSHIRRMPDELASKYFEGCRQKQKLLESNMVKVRVGFDPLDREFSSKAFQEVRKALPSNLMNKLNLNKDLYTQCVPRLIEFRTQQKLREWERRNHQRYGEPMHQAHEDYIPY